MRHRHACGFNQVGILCPVRLNLSDVSTDPRPPPACIYSAEAQLYINQAYLALSYLFFSHTPILPPPTHLSGCCTVIADYPAFWNLSGRCIAASRAYQTNPSISQNNQDGTTRSETSDTAMQVQDWQDTRSRFLFSRQRMRPYRHRPILCCKGYQQAPYGRSRTYGQE